MDKGQKTAISCQGLSKRFDQLKALDNVSFDVQSGAIFGFLGPNGSGKSTFIKIITGLISATNGSYSIFENSGMNGACIRKEIGALVDRADFYKNLSGFRNMEILARITGHHQKDHINELLDLMGLYHRRHDKVKTYSQGMKQRLGLAQSLITRPKLLILDEPTTGLDPIGMVEVRNFIRKIAEQQKVTVFLSSHMLHEVEEICTDFALIFNGRLSASGPIESIYAGMEMVTVDLEVDNLPSAMDFLSRCSLVSDIRPARHLIRFSIRYHAIPELVRKLTAENIAVFGISQRNRLEEFFITQTESSK